jgi:hypothetical protein
VFGGSSVTAGHDNYYNQSYPYIILARMSPILKALGIEMVVRNIAQGANNCIPYVFCYESMGGHDFDVLGWEQVNLTHSFTHTLTHSLTHSLTYSLTHSLTH